MPLKAGFKQPSAAMASKTCKAESSEFIQLPHNLHKSIVPRYVPNFEYRKAVEYIPVPYEQLDLVAEDLALGLPDFSTATIEKYRKVIQEYNLERRFLSYALYAAAKNSGNSDLQQKFAHFIERISLFWTVNRELWNDNGMWQWPNPYPLHVAVRANLKQVIEVLLKKDAKVNQKESSEDAHERTPLHYAQSHEVADMLLEKRANVNAQDGERNTPLHLCPAELIPLLLANDADISIKNRAHDHLVEFNYESYSGKICEYEEKETLKKKFEIIKEDEENITCDYIDDDRGCYHRAYTYHGLTPLMEAIADRKSERFATFLKVCRPEDIAKQIKPLRVMTACAALRSEKGKQLSALLQEYEKNIEKIGKI